MVLLDFRGDILVGESSLALEFSGSALRSDPAACGEGGRGLGGRGQRGCGCRGERRSLLLLLALGLLPRDVEAGRGWLQHELVGG